MTALAVGPALIVSISRIIFRFLVRAWAATDVRTGIIVPIAPVAKISSVSGFAPFFIALAKVLIAIA